MDDIVKRIRQQSYFGLEPYEAANEIEQLRQRVQELEQQFTEVRRAERERVYQVADNAYATEHVLLAIRAME